MTVASRNGVALSAVSSVNGVTRSAISAINGQTLPALALTGLDFPSNNAANSDIRLLLHSSAWSRTSMTMLWKRRWRQQTGYPAFLCLSPKSGSWDSGVYTVIFTGHPCDGTYDSTGQRLVGTGSSGTVHYDEIAGLLAAADFIASPSSPGPQSTFLLVDNTWRNQCAVIEPVSTQTQHTYYADLASRPTEFIRQSVTTASIGSGTGSGGPFGYLGAHDWTATGSTNEECPSGVYRGFQSYQPALTNTTHITALSKLETDGEVLAYCSANGITAPKYLCMNPTPTDVTDKSGNGNNPSWDNARRPTLWNS